MTSGRILVTGGSGFIGTNLVEACATAGQQVVNVDIQPPRNPLHRPYWQAVDLLDADRLADTLTAFSPQVIYHFGARDGSSRCDRTRLRQQCRRRGEPDRRGRSDSRTWNAWSLHPRGWCAGSAISRFPTTTTAPPRPMAAARCVASSSSGRQAGNGFRWFIVRPTSIWGPWFDIPYKTFFTTVAGGRYLHPGARKIAKSFGYVENAVFQLQRLLAAPAQETQGRTFYLADHQPMDVLEMATAIQRLTNTRPIRSVPPRVLKCAAYLGDALKFAGYRSRRSPRSAEQSADRHGA